MTKDTKETIEAIALAFIFNIALFVICQCIWNWFHRPEPFIQCSSEKSSVNAMQDQYEYYPLLDCEKQANDWTNFYGELIIW